MLLYIIGLPLTRDQRHGVFSGLTAPARYVTIGPMIELISFLLGLGFSILVYFRSIRNTGYPPLTKAWYAIITFVGITGILLLVGIMLSYFLAGGRNPR